MAGLSVLRPQGPVSLTSGILGLQSILCFLGFFCEKKQTTLGKNLRSKNWVKIRYYCQPLKEWTSAHSPRILGFPLGCHERLQDKG